MLKTAVLLAFLTALLLVVGEILGGSGGLTIALIFALGINFISYWYSDKIVLSMAGAHEVSPAEAPDLHAIVADVAHKAGLPMPRVYIVDNASPNAFATGRDPQHAAVAATSGILQILGPDELAGVLAHEMAHIRNRDTLIATIAATIAGAITYLAQMGQWALMFGGFGGRRDSRNGGFGGEALLMIILAPLAAMLIQLAISRSREYNADSNGARITGDPLALANALERLERQIAYRPMTNTAPTTAPLYIVNPFGPGMFQKLFSDHPPTAERVARLRKLAFQQVR